MAESKAKPRGRPPGKGKTADRKFRLHAPASDHAPQSARALMADHSGPNVDRARVVMREMVDSVDLETFRESAEHLVSLYAFLDGVPLREVQTIEMFLSNRFSTAQCVSFPSTQNLYPGKSPNEIIRILMSKPPIARFAAEWRAERERLYGVTMHGQLKRLEELSRGAERAGQYAAAISAEKLRSAMSGLTTDRRQTVIETDRDALMDKLRGLLSDPRVATVLKSGVIEAHVTEMSGSVEDAVQVDRSGTGSGTAVASGGEATTGERLLELLKKVPAKDVFPSTYRDDDD
jgi:hypothetical protein